jgi:hypothetical protein
MKYAGYQIENNTVSIYNSITGIERIHLNGREVSKAFSWFGSDHLFKIGENQYTVKPYITLKNCIGIGFAIYKNGVPVTFQNKITKKDKRNLVFRIIFAVGIGLAVGFCVGFLLGTPIEFGIIHH